VDDGSTSGGEFLDRLEKDGSATVLHHGANQGKGSALKTGIRWMKEHGFDEVITADADGQHALSDIVHMAQEMERSPGQLLLGVRDTSKMPPRSKMGNQLTRVLFRILYGICLQDTQTGLRGIPLTEDSLPGLLDLPGDRYEYEMEMLLHSPELFPEGIREIPIRTIYEDNNKSSHFRPIRDGAKIYSVLLCNLPGFLLTSLLSFGVDYALFNLLYYFLFHISVPATVLARLISGTLNYECNRHLVFGAKKEGDYNAWNYLKLAAGILLINSSLMYLLADVLGFPAFAVKVMVECALYLFNFTIQNKWASSSI
jgi:dolichol-phosphate mannosyltransferase